MILVDTNVWSETTKPRPDQTVVAWLRRHHDEAALTTITAGELLTGLAIMPEGKRRDELAVRIEGLLARSQDRIYAYDIRAARAIATIKAARRRMGREVQKPEDAMIAAIAASRGFAVATRNVDDFEGMGIRIINPWDPEP